MRTVIIAGGKGTRINEFYPDLPKPMIPILGKPLLQHQIEVLVSQGFIDITLVVGYKYELICDYFADGAIFGANIDYIIEETPLGTGGALTLLKREDVLIVYGDVFFDINLTRFIGFHNEKQAGITLFAHPNNHPHDSDIIETDCNGKVLAWKSKNDKLRGDLRNLVNAGLYVFSGSSLPIGERKKRDLEQEIILPALMNGTVYAYRSTEYIKDMGTPDRLTKVEENVKSGVTAARNLNNKQKAVFIDRDGTINEHNDLISSPGQLKLIKGVAEAIRCLNNSPYLVLCITNQPVMARGLVTSEGLDEIHARMDTLLGNEGAYLDDLFYCPHHPDKGYPEEIPELKIDCLCRKPKPGLLLEAASRYNINLTLSYMIGDSTADIAAGRAAGCKTIGVKTGMGLGDGKYQAECDYIVDDLSEAVVIILSGKRKDKER